MAESCCTRKPANHYEPKIKTDLFFDELIAVSPGKKPGKKTDKKK
jgi:hypothetical protein